jgi:hypothetical protein
MTAWPGRIPGRLQRVNELVGNERVGQLVSNERVNELVGNERVGQLVSKAVARHRLRNWA